MNKIERIARVVEITIEQMLIYPSDDPRVDILVYRYNFWSDRLDQELRKDLSIDIYHLNISEFMRHIITHIVSEMTDPYGYIIRGNKRIKISNVR
jgi:hypothetical protein